MSTNETAWLQCPECDADAAPSDGLGCFECGDGEDFGGHEDEACTSPLVPVWL